MAIQKEEVFTIRSIDYKESDSILTLLGRKGKFSAIAKGARKSTSKFGSAFDLLNFSEVVYYAGSGLAFLKEGELLESWEGLKRREGLIGAGLRSARLLNLLLEENQPEASTYSLFGATLKALDHSPPRGEIVELGFYLKLLSLLGLKPSLIDCVKCGAKLDGGSFKFSNSLGGVLCENCASGGEDELGEALRRTLIKLSQLPQGKVARVRLSESSAKRAFALLDRFAAYHLPDRGRKILRRD